MTPSDELAPADALELELATEARERGQALEREPPGPELERPPTARALERELERAHALLDRRERWLRELRDRVDANAAARAADGHRQRPLGAPTVPVAIIVPVHNAPTELQACFAALVRNTTAPARLVFVDDLSTDARVVQTLLDWQRFAGVELLRNSVNRGFTGTVNRALRATAGYDVVILNSDTAVTPRWLERLTSTAYSDPLIATVTPLSDNAGAFAVPCIGEQNPVPLFIDADGASRAIAQHSEMLLPRTPTANGFCMYVKRAVIEQIGYLDGAAFPRGYGEENDFCMRALRAGWHHVVDDRVFIHHVREASFGAHKRRLMAEGRAKVNERYPEYTPLVREFVDSAEMARVRANTTGAYDRSEQAYDRGSDGRHELRPRVLFVAHEGRGGTPATNLDLMRELEAEYDCWLLSSTGAELRLGRLDAGELAQVDRWRLSEPVSAHEISCPEYRKLAAGILDRHAIELVHVRHLFKHTFDLPQVAASRGIPVVLSFHDFYFTCPTVHLLDDRHVYCGGTCTEGAGSCRIPTALLEGLPPLKHRFVYEWRADAQQMLAGVDAFVTSSPHARDVHLKALPSLEGRTFAVIEHGRDLDGAAVATAPYPGGPVRIAVPGNLDIHKGAEFMRSMLEHDRTGRIRFHLLGDVPERYRQLGRNHGRYEREELAGRLASIRPAFVGIFSIWAETYCHTLSEAWAAGVPVVATRLGALRERIERHGGGWLVDPGDPQGAVESILAVADDPQAYARGRAAATVHNVRTVAEMAGDFSALYREVIDRRRSFVPSRARPRERHLGHGVLRAEVVVPGDDGNYPASTHVRMLRRLYHPSVRRKLHATVRHGGELGAIGRRCDVVIVQRTAIPPERLDWFLATVTDRGLPLVVDLDDDLFALGAQDEEYGHRLASLERLLSAASLVTVSTPALERRLARRGTSALLLENAIDERLFFAGQAPPGARRRSPAGEVQALYMGLPTHEQDLMLLEPVFRRLRESGVPVRLTVAGRFGAGHEADWYRSLPVPPGRGGYPQFVRWLRAHATGMDLAVAPLLNTQFNAAKSDLKFLEYAALGLPGAFSRVEPYASVEHGVTGLLVDNDVDAWHESITRLAEDRHERTEIAERALEYVRGERLIRHGADGLLSALFDVVAGELEDATPGPTRRALEMASGWQRP